MNIEAIDEDAPISSLLVHGSNEEAEVGDEMQDFRFLAALTGTKQVIPKRGDKDFEPHGTKHQESVLDASRRAMHEVLEHTRVHIPKSHVRAWYIGGRGAAGEPDEMEVNALDESVRGRGLERSHVVMVENAKGGFLKSMGKTALGILPPRLWLLPEEALYLVERGSLDLWWPESPLAAVRGEYENESLESEEVHGVPLSLEATYALLVGDGEGGTTSLDNYLVYAHLRRIGYMVMRASHQSSHQSSPVDRRRDEMAAVTASSVSLFARLFGHIFYSEPSRSTSTPLESLVQPGLYRSYEHIFHHLAIVTRHKPLALPLSPLNETVDPFRVVYHIWKPSRSDGFAKSNPGHPDFRIGIVSAQSTSLPSLAQLTDLLASTPWNPPREEWSGPEKMMPRLKHGWRNVILAVVDQGVISYLRFCEAAFGEERLYEKFDRRGSRSTKRGRPQNRGGSRGGRGGKRK